MFEKVRVNCVSVCLCLFMCVGVSGNKCFLFFFCFVCLLGVQPSSGVRNI